MQQLVNVIIENPALHRRWINTLSYLENCGAKKIARFEHPSKVSLGLLKHAAEEKRHAYLLKMQLERIPGSGCEDFQNSNLLGGYQARQYLQKLDVLICRYLKQDFQLQGRKLKNVAYALVTYAIEVRASKLYPMYHRILKAKQIPINVLPIIKEEEAHLAEMETMLRHEFAHHTDTVMTKARKLEEALFEGWIRKVKAETA